MNDSSLRVRVALALVVAVFAASCGSSPDSSSTVTKHRSASPTILLVLDADTGESNAPGEDGAMTFTLRAPDHDALWFNDRPQRQFGDMELRDVVDLWKTPDVREDPPNAAIEFVDDVTNKRHHAVMTITDMKMRADGAVTVTGMPLTTSPATTAARPDGRRLDVLPQSFTSPTMFIDAFPTSVNDQITDSVT